MKQHNFFSKQCLSLAAVYQQLVYLETCTGDLSRGRPKGKSSQAKRKSSCKIKRKWTSIQKGGGFFYFPDILVVHILSAPGKQVFINQFLRELRRAKKEVIPAIVCMLKQCSYIHVNIEVFWIFPRHRCSPATDKTHQYYAYIV